MPVSEATYQAIVLEESDDTWELVCGHLWKKPTMTQAHRDATTELSYMLRGQLSPEEFKISNNHSRARLPSGEYFVPDIAVIPAALAGPTRGGGREIDAYAEPLPLIVEVWSPSTGDYDVSTKLPGYMARGDLEIWILHPYRVELTVWRLQTNGSYTEHHYGAEDTVEVLSLPGVRIRLASVCSP